MFPYLFFSGDFYAWRVHTLICLNYRSNLFFCFLFRFGNCLHLRQQNQAKIAFFKRKQACRKSPFAHREKLRQAFKHNSYRKQYRKYFRLNFKRAFLRASSCRFIFESFCCLNCRNNGLLRNTLEKPTPKNLRCPFILCLQFWFLFLLRWMLFFPAGKSWLKKSSALTQEM